MSQENVEQFKRGAEASNRRDIEALLNTLDPGVQGSPAFPVLLGGEAKVYLGHDGVREMFRAFYDALDEIHAEHSETATSATEWWRSAASAIAVRRAGPRPSRLS